MHLIYNIFRLPVVRDEIRDIDSLKFHLARLNFCFWVFAWGVELGFPYKWCVSYSQVGFFKFGMPCNELR